VAMTGSKVGYSPSDSPTGTTPVRSAHLAASANLTLERGLDILECLAASGVPLSVEALREATGLPSSSAYRILRSLLDRGWVAAAAGSGYISGLRFIGLAGSLRLDRWMGAVVPNDLRLVAQRTGETILMTVISGQFALCVARVEGSRLVRASLEPGSLLPLHSGASALVLLAWASTDLIDGVLSRPLARYTNETSGDPEKLRERLQSIRTAGYAITTGEVDAGVTAIAVPVPLDSASTAYRIIGPIGLSVVGPSDRLGTDVHDAILRDLRSCAAAVAETVSTMP
jgi:DNA-binding IclR family transcriptional regulator